MKPKWNVKQVFEKQIKYKYIFLVSFFYKIYIANASNSVQWMINLIWSAICVDLVVSRSINFSSISFLRCFDILKAFPSRNKWIKIMNYWEKKERVNRTSLSKWIHFRMDIFPCTTMSSTSHLNIFSSPKTWSHLR